MTSCSAKCCPKVGTRFDAASVELFACEEHKTKWYTEMIDLGVSCVTSHTDPDDDNKCCNINCDEKGYYMINGTGYCFCHAEAGALCTHINYDGNVIKMRVKVCEFHHHKDVCINNDPESCQKCKYAKKLKNDQ